MKQPLVDRLYQSPERRPIHPVFIFLIAHFGKELDPDQTDLLFGVFPAELVDRIFDTVAFALLEVFENIIDMLVVHDFVQEVVDIDFRTGVNDCFDLVEQFVEIEPFRFGKFVEGYFPIA